MRVREGKEARMTRQSMTRRMLTGTILVWASCSKHSGQKTDAAATESGLKGSGTAGTGAGGAIDLDASVLERNKHPSRDGHFVQPTLTKALAAKMALDSGFLALFKGAMYASPLYLASGR